MNPVFRWVKLEGVWTIGMMWPDGLVGFLGTELQVKKERLEKIGRAVSKPFWYVDSMPIAEIHDIDYDRALKELDKEFPGEVVS